MISFLLTQVLSDAVTIVVHPLGLPAHFYPYLNYIISLLGIMDVSKVHQLTLEIVR
jgi:urea transporter